MSGYSWVGTGSDTIPYQLSVRNEVVAKPAQGVGVRFCALALCGAHCFDAAPDAVTDANGSATVQVAYGHEGCFAVGGDGHWTPVLFYPGRPIVSGDYGDQLPEAPAGSMALLAASFGSRQDPGFGAVYALEFDCFADAGITATFQSSNAGASADWLYSGNGGTFAHGASGNPAVAFDHQAGPTTVTGSVKGREVSDYNVQVVPDTLTVVYLEPKPVR